MSRNEFTLFCALLAVAVFAIGWRWGFFAAVGVGFCLLAFVFVTEKLLTQRRKLTS